MTKIRAVLVLAASALVLVPACKTSNAPADVDDAVEPVRAESPGRGNAENMTPGPCATACAQVASGECNWRNQCDDHHGRPEVAEMTAFCGQKTLSCTAAHEAGSGEAEGLMECYRECEGLR
jgi:hypothetical protein